MCVLPSCSELHAAMEMRGFDCGCVQFVFLAASLLLVGRLEGMPIGGRGEGAELNEWEERGVEDLSPSEMIYLANQGWSVI